MSLADIMKSAASEAQGVLAEISGAKPGRKNFHLAGAGYVGVLRISKTEVPAVGTGYEVVEELIITASKDQFAAAPKAAPRQTVAAMDRSWYLVSVSDRQPLYELVCRPA